MTLSGMIVDVVGGTMFPGTLHIEGGRITRVEKGGRAGGPYILPGLIDAHVHIESSMLLPSEFARLAVVHGTTGSVSDPHEIANVLGVEGVRFMIDNGRKVPFRFCFGAPSCVPATAFETAGASLGLAEVEELLALDEVKYLSEMMNFPGVLHADPEVMAKLGAAARAGKPVDGHAPGLRAEGAARYAAAGISTDHECFDLDEAREKIHHGMKVLIREGSAARNFDTLLPLLAESPEKVMFCSDDKHPDDLVAGHLDILVRRALAAGYEPIPVLRAVTLNPIRHYGMEAGLLQEGDMADFIIVDDLDTFRVRQTWIGGQLVAEDGRSLIAGVQESAPNKFLARMPRAEELRVAEVPGALRVLRAFDGQLITESCTMTPRVEQGEVVCDPGRDLLKLVVLNRYAEALPALGFITGFGLKRGALASTVAHDSHNIICVGTNDTDILRAISLLIQCKGGIVAVDGNQEVLLPLPVAGIMSDRDGYTVARDYERLDAQAKALGSGLRSPFMTLSFMALLVIPSLKLSDQGIFDGDTFRFTTLFKSL
ncbi:MAG TPA: adenine deaminase [Bacteroidales bacterium]|nr:adenine deaminase [Bacteroidales bacterium]